MNYMQGDLLNTVDVERNNFFLNFQRREFTPKPWDFWAVYHGPYLWPESVSSTLTLPQPPSFINFSWSFTNGKQILHNLSKIIKKHHSLFKNWGIRFIELDIYMEFSNCLCQLCLRVQSLFLHYFFFYMY